MEPVNTISLSEALQKMRNGRAFSITGCEYNKKKKTGGKRYQYTGVRLSGDNAATKKAKQQRLDRSGELESDETKIILKNPNHRINGTRNVVLPNNDIVTVHIRLLESFNGKRIIL